MEQVTVKLYNRTVALDVYSAEEAISAKGISIDAAIYGRLSQDEIKTRSLSKKVQRTEALKICATNDWKRVAVCIERDFAKGDDFSRPKLQEVLQLVKLGRTKRILARDEERLWRGTATMNQVVNAVAPYGVSLHTFAGPLDFRSADGRFRLEIMAALAGQRPRKDAENIRRIIEKNWEMGYTHGSPAYGYTTQTREVSKLLASCKEDLYKGRAAEDIDEEELLRINNEIDQRRTELLVEVSRRYPTFKIKYILDDEADMVVLCFHCYVNLRWGSDRIVSYLNDEKTMRDDIPFRPDDILSTISEEHRKTWDKARIRSLLNRRVFKTRLGKPWYINTVRNILSNPVYVGWATYDCEARAMYAKPRSNKLLHQRNKNAKHTAIITEACFLKAVEIRAENFQKLRPKLHFKGEGIRNPKSYPATVVLVDDLGRRPAGKSAGSEHGYGYYLFKAIRHGVNRRGSLALNNRETDRAILEAIQARISEPETVLKIIREHNQRIKGGGTERSAGVEELTSQRSLLEKKQSKYMRLLEDAEDEDIEKVARAKIAEFTSAMAQVDAKISLVKAQSKVTLGAVDYKQGAQYLKQLNEHLSRHPDRLGDLLRLLKDHHNLKVLAKSKADLILSLEFGYDGQSIHTNGPDFSARLVYPPRLGKNHAGSPPAHDSAGPDAR
jgi:DNA invertase Pin-like site-specific DNA recombinase